MKLRLIPTFRFLIKLQHDVRLIGQKTLNLSRFPRQTNQNYCCNFVNLQHYTNKCTVMRIKQYNRSVKWFSWRTARENETAHAVMHYGQHLGMHYCWNIAFPRHTRVHEFHLLPSEKQGPPYNGFHGSQKVLKSSACKTRTPNAPKSDNKCGKLRGREFVYSFCM